MWGGGGGSYISIKQMKLAVMTLCQDTESVKCNTS